MGISNVPMAQTVQGVVPVQTVRVDFAIVVTSAELFLMVLCVAWDQIVPVDSVIVVAPVGLFLRALCVRWEQIVQAGIVFLVLVNRELKLAQKSNKGNKGDGLFYF